MADKKISQLTGASTPLAGTEVLPIVQSGNTVKVSVANLTAGRTVDATTVNATTVDTTNIEVTTIKAKDGTAAGSIADSTGVVTLASSVLTTTDINGGTIDGTTIGANSAAAGTFTTLTGSTKTVSPFFDAVGSAGGQLRNASGTSQLAWGAGGGSNLSLEVATNINPANANVSLAPTGTGTVTINPATAGTMNNVAIGGSTAAAGSFTTLTTSSTVTLNGGTANGVVYLDSSKVATSGSAITFNGTNFSVSGAIAATTAFRETNGASGNIANGATFTITIPTPRRPQLLVLYSDFNLNQGWFGLIQGDGSGNIGTNVILNLGAIGISGTAGNVVTVTNNYGGTANIRWSLLPLGVSV